MSAAKGTNTATECDDNINDQNFRIVNLRISKVIHVSL